ncbi:high light inducible protein [filamentous cyanobacterium LEGE 11480]|uniref:High light inducible protein n=1 Tax=Romeriopsis navalis LEGE 11480 TaxID=2777977 RepID=A0A928VT05_9CYAN|nr:chlorophyll a/b-binding protein [Romeriopsis navalis]MBE9032471.1 high light inducible protein [Romeriopsis navalis LEGE 11480]
MTARSYTIEENGTFNNFAVEPEMYVDESVQTGFTQYAEMMNGRFAMIGFVALLLTEALSGHSFISIMLGQ